MERMAVKTTMAKLIEKSMVFVCFLQGDISDEYSAFANPKFQLTLSASCSRNMDWYRYFSRLAIFEIFGRQLKWTNRNCHCGFNKTIPGSKGNFDVDILPEVLQRISEPSRVILLFVPEEMTKKHYFDHKNKRDIYQLIKSFPDANKLLQNVIGGYALWCRCRKGDTIERTLEKIEKHFGMSK